jgi:hypothetical protein
MTTESLRPQHQKLLDDSRISSEVATRRGYRSAKTASDLEKLGFSRKQCSAPALVIPLYNLRGEQAGYQIRRDDPRVIDGKPAKYESPKGQANILDVHPSSRERLADPQRALFVTEGVRKAVSAVSQKLCCIALAGVYGWKGTNAYGGPTALADWESIALKGRRVFLAFDSDVMCKCDLYTGLQRLKVFLEGRGAEVRVIYLPAGELDKKVGLDDYFAAGHTPQELLELAEVELRPLPMRPESEEAPTYQETETGLIWQKPTGHGAVPVKLTNFHAQIIADITRDDGSEGGEPAREFQIQASLHGRTRRFRVAARDFDSLIWVPEYVGAAAVISAGHAVRDHARAAMRILSTPEQRTIYARLGWHKIGGTSVFLHAGGALGPAGPVDGVEVDLPHDLHRYRLPDPPDPAATQEAVRRSLSAARIAPARQSWPLLASVYTAPLGEILSLDFTVWIHGDSGTRKSSYAALLLNHFGVFRDLKDLPANFMSTANSLEQLLFVAKDTLLVADDYCPQSDARSAAQQDATATRLIRARGNSQGRNRLTRDSRLIGEKPPRCLPLTTAELPPPGTQSSAARTLTVEWPTESVDLKLLTQAQQEDAPFYAQAMAAFIVWLAQHEERLRQELPSQVQQLRRRFERAGVAHGRVAESAAKLGAGVATFLRFAEDVGTFTDEECHAYGEEASRAIFNCAVLTGRRQADRRPTVLFREILGTLLLQKRIFLAGKDGRPPAPQPALWGYTPDSMAYPLDESDPTVPMPRPHPEQVGWVDPEEGFVYLVPEAAYKAVASFARTSDTRFPSSNKEALADALDREGLLCRQAKGRRTCSVRAQGTTQWCWVLRISDLLPGLCDGGPDTEGPGSIPDGEGPDPEGHISSPVSSAEPGLETGASGGDVRSSQETGHEAGAVSSVSTVSSTDTPYHIAARRECFPLVHWAPPFQTCARA